MKLTFPNPIIILTSTMMVFMIVVGYLQFPKLFTNQPPYNTGSGSTGVLLPTQTGSQNTGTSTGDFTEVDYLTTLSGITDTVDRIRYILSFGRNGVDYFSQNTVVQDLLLGGTKSSNNTLLHSFLQKYQYPFTLTKGGYLVVITQQPIPANRDMLIAVNGKTIGVINKTSDGRNFISDLVKDPEDTIYIFPINNIKIVQPERVMINLMNYGEKSNLSLAIGQNGNSVLRIAIVQP